MVRPAFDQTLADLANITVTASRPVALASRENPSMLTVTIESGLFQQILTAASLHMSDNRFQPKPEIGDYAETIAENNAANQDWHWMMEDTINILTARASKAAHGTNGSDKEDSLKSTRSSRELMAKMDKDDKAKAEALDPETPEGVMARWDAANVNPLSNRQIADLMGKLLAESDTAVAWEIAAPLFETYRREASKLEKLEKRVASARNALNGF